MSLLAIDVNIGKTAENMYNRVKDKIDSNPKQSILYAFAAAGLTGAVSFLQTKDINALESIPLAGSRIFQLYSPDIINNAMTAFDSIEKGLSDSGADWNLIREGGFSGLKEYIPLACAGLIQGAEGYGNEKVTKRKINLPDADNYDTIDIPEQNAEEDKQGHGKLYAGLLVGGVLTFGTVGFIYSQMTGEDTATTEIPPASDPIIPVETDTPVHTPEPTAEPTVEPTAEKISHPFDINDPHIAYIPIDSSENLFNIDIEDGYKFTNSVNGNYNYFDSDKNMIFQHSEHPNYDLYSELQPEQARALEAEYGELVSLKMEQIDTDGNGMDKVAVRYEGREGILEFETDIMKNANGRVLNVGPGSYISAHMY